VGRATGAARVGAAKLDACATVGVGVGQSADAEAEAEAEAGGVDARCAGLAVAASARGVAASTGRWATPAGVDARCALGLRLRDGVELDGVEVSSTGDSPPASALLALRARCARRSLRLSLPSALGTRPALGAPPSGLIHSCGANADAVTAGASATAKLAEWVTRQRASTNICGGDTSMAVLRGPHSRADRISSASWTRAGVPVQSPLARHGTNSRIEGRSEESNARSCWAVQFHRSAGAPEGPPEGAGPPEGPRGGGRVGPPSSSSRRCLPEVTARALRPTSRAAGAGLCIVGRVDGKGGGWAV